MKRAYLILCLIVWFSSIIIAFTIGRSNSTASVKLEDVDYSPQASAPISDPSGLYLTSLSTAPELGSTANETLAAYFEGSVVSLSDVLSQLDRLRPDEARSYIEQAFTLPNSDPQRARLITGLLAQLATTHPEEAYGLTASITSLRDSERAKVAILETWAKSDPLAVLNWAETALVGEPSHLYGSQMQAIFRGYAALNPNSAFVTAQSMPTNTRNESRLRNRLMGEVIETQVNNGGVEAAKLAISLLDDSDLRDEMTQELVNEWAQFDAQGAAAYVESLGDAASTRIKSELVDEWAESDPAAAAAWLMTLDEGDPAIARAASDVIREWTRYDLTASAEWLNSLPASPDLDRAVASYTFRASQEDPASAMTWAESISNDWIRTRLVQSVAGTWKNDDPEAFESYVESSDFSDERKEELRSAQSGGGRGFGGGRSPFGRR